MEEEEEKDVAFPLSPRWGASEAPRVIESMMTPSWNRAWSSSRLAPLSTLMQLSLSSLSTCIMKGWRNTRLHRRLVAKDLLSEVDVLLLFSASSSTQDSSQLACVYPKEAKDTGGPDNGTSTPIATPTVTAVQQSHTLC